MKAINVNVTKILKPCERKIKLYVKNSDPEYLFFQLLNYARTSEERIGSTKVNFIKSKDYVPENLGA